MGLGFDKTQIEPAHGSASSKPKVETAGAPQRKSAFRPGRHFTPGLLVIIGAAVALTALMMSQAPVLAAGSTSAAGSEAGSGEALYVEHCGACHQPTGLGLIGTFPPVAGNPAAADPAYVETVIREGKTGELEVLGVVYDQDMPPVIALTDSDEIQQVVDFVTELAGGADAATDQPSTDDAASDTGQNQKPDAAAAPLTGDADRGRDLFVGAKRFDGGAVACAACHQAGSVGNLGGTSLGPDLTLTYNTLGGEVGLSGWLANPPSQTMQPIFADRALTEAELADVVAFLGDTPGQEAAAGGIDRLSLAGLAGLLVLLGGMAVAWRGMRQTYAERLRSRR